ncbi:anti-sigma factor [Rhodoligotrophos defluvii]|uniref:anti-sigma factor n=1 Tax=Rhodoligotrophos defluvii TaxID=2561934 RepID=UPI0010C9B5CF|nr:anti-sigma factor [Rhodoligotrophos defluvii]
MDQRQARLHFSDETLMAYADGQLDEKVALAIEGAMTEDPGLVARVVAFIRSRHLAREAFSHTPSTPVPPELEAAVRSAIAGQGQPADKPASPIPPAPPPARASAERPARHSSRKAALAASIALVIGLGLGALGGQRLEGSAEPPEQAGLLASLDHPEILANLGTLPSGAEQSTPAGTLRAIASFKRPDGSLCREFTVSDSQVRREAVACRDDGDWQVTFATLEPTSSAEYVPAGDDGPMAAYLRQAGLGQPLDREAEQVALGN